jgi:hypothetical protein
MLAIGSETSRPRGHGHGLVRGSAGFAYLAFAQAIGCGPSARAVEVLGWD